MCEQGWGCLVQKYLETQQVQLPLSQLCILNKIVH